MKIRYITIEAFGWELSRLLVPFVVLGVLERGEPVASLPDGRLRGTRNGAVCERRPVWIVCVGAFSRDQREFRSRWLASALWWAWRNRRSVDRP